MIITCEKCGARYLLTQLLLGGDGRNVRCGVCSHTWFQEPVEEEPFEDDEDSDGGDEDSSPFQKILDQEALEPIPEGVRPIPEGSSVPVINQAASRAPLGRDAMNGFLAAAAFFILISGTLVMMRSAVVQAWQPSALLFEIVGLPVPVPGEGLVFDKVVAAVGKDGKTLTLKGNVINLRGHESPLPGIQATLQKSNGQPGESLAVDVGGKTIGPEETLSFAAQFDRVPEDMTDVYVRFVGR